MYYHFYWIVSIPYFWYCFGYQCTIANWYMCTCVHKSRELPSSLGAFVKAEVLQFMMTSPDESIFRVTGGFPSQRPVTRSCDIFYELRLNKRLSKQSRRRRIETQSRWLRRHWNVHLHMHEAAILKYLLFCINYMCRYKTRQKIYHFINVVNILPNPNVVTELDCIIKPFLTRHYTRWC